MAGGRRGPPHSDRLQRHCGGPIQSGGEPQQAAGDRTHQKAPCQCHPCSNSGYPTGQRAGMDQWRAEVRQRRHVRRTTWRLPRRTVGRMGAEPLERSSPLPLLEWSASEKKLDTDLEWIVTSYSVVSLENILSIYRKQKQKLKKHFKKNKK